MWMCKPLIRGSGVVEDINHLFEIDSVNRVTWAGAYTRPLFGST